VSVEPAASSSAQRDVAHWRAESLHLETADRTIELVGPVQVVGGSRYDARRGRLPRLEAPRREVVAEAIPWSTGSIYGALALHVADGDEVEVRGAPQPSAGPGETTPRDADISWSMRGDDGPLQIAAITPVVPRLPLGIVRTVLVGLLSFGASTWALRSCGDRWVTQCHYLAHGDGESAIELDNTHTCVLAASTPKRREDGLRALSDYLDEDPYRDEQTVARLDALARDTVGCVQLAASLLQAQRYDAALAESRGCGAIRIEHEALVALGHFEQAAALPVPAAEHEPALPAPSHTSTGETAISLSGDPANATQADELVIVTLRGGEGREVLAFHPDEAKPRWTAARGVLAFVRCAGDRVQPCVAGKRSPSGNVALVRIDPATGVLGEQLSDEADIADAAIDALGGSLAWVVDNSEVHEKLLQPGGRAQVLAPRRSGIHTIAYDPTGGVLVSSNTPEGRSIVRLSEGRVDPVVNAGQTILSLIRPSPDGTQLLYRIRTLTSDLVEIQLPSR
jgi:hypothetical protein